MQIASDVRLLHKLEYQSKKSNYNLRAGQYKGWEKDPKAY